MQWEKRIHKSLNSMCNETGVPLARFRLASDRDELEEKWTELSTYDIGEPQAEINKCTLWFTSGIKLLLARLFITS
jgi:hypothetical protein